MGCNQEGCSDINSDSPAIPIETVPAVPANVRHALEGSAIRVSWDPAEGADYYNLYYHYIFDSGCALNVDGSLILCEQLVANVVGTSYIHTAPDSGGNYYWVVACNRGGCSEIDSDNPASAPGTSSAGSTSDPSGSSQLEFREGESATRSIPENTPGGINLGDPISAEGGGAPTYAISGPDAASFSVVPTTGQLRTNDGVAYDYETKNRYVVAVDAADESGERDSIEVIIHIEDLVPACEPVRNLRTNAGEGYLTVKWAPAVQREGKATALGYQVEMRRGDDGPWTARRTVLGRSIGSTIYGELENLDDYWFRIRPINTESDCGWSPPRFGSPSTYTTPIYPTDRFGAHPVGSPDRYWRFVTQDRCRYGADGVVLDANCRFEHTGPHSGRIVLEFDDPSRGACDIALAFSSLTAGSFVDDCFDAGVNTETPFDTSFRMPPTGPQTESDVAVPRSPRSREEFDVLAWGRDDLIPGLHFGCPPIVSGCEFNPGLAWRVERDPDTGLPHYMYGEYTYENTGPTEGRLTFQTLVGDRDSYEFTLDFGPDGNMRVTVTDDAGKPSSWPGFSDLDLELGGQPILLPIPPSWSAAIAIETDVTPVDWDDLEMRIPTPQDPELPESPRLGLLKHTLLGDVWDRAYEGSDATLELSHDSSFSRIGRNRVIVSIRWVRSEIFAGLGLSAFQEGLLGSTWAYDLNFTSDTTAEYTLTITKDGSVSSVRRGFVDFNGDSINLNEFPDEALPPVAPPQASGADLSGVEVAAAITTTEISGADVQTFLISDQGVQPAAYQPGDWLEPKDGSNQRMMIVASNQVAAAASDASGQGVYATALRYVPRLSSALMAKPAMFRGWRTTEPVRFALFTTSASSIPLGVSASVGAASEPRIIRLSGACLINRHP